MVAIEARFLASKMSNNDPGLLHFQLVYHQEVEANPDRLENASQIP